MITSAHSMSARAPARTRSDLIFGNRDCRHHPAVVVLHLVFFATPSKSMGIVQKISTSTFRAPTRYLGATRARRSLGFLLTGNDKFDAAARAGAELTVARVHRPRPDLAQRGLLTDPRLRR